MHLFKKDLFSVKNPLFSPLNSADSNELKTIVKRHYPNLSIDEIHKIGAFEINSNNWKILSGNAAYILKRSNLNKLESLSAQAQWTFQLEESSFPTLQFLKNNEGKLISKEGPYVYCITYFEEGQYFGSSLQEWSDLVANQKKLFEYCLKDSSFNSLNLPSRDFFTLEENRLIAALKSYPEIKGVSQLQMISAIEEFEKLQDLFHLIQNRVHRSVFHVDIHPQNLIYNNNKLVLFTDFESFQLTCIEVSLGFGLYKCMRQLLSLEESQQPHQFSENIHQLRDQFYQYFPDHDFTELITLGKIDILKRVLYILKELVDQGESQWFFVLQAQMNALDEVNEIRRILS